MHLSDLTVVIIFIQIPTIPFVNCVGSVGFPESHHIGPMGYKLMMTYGRTVYLNAFTYTFHIIRVLQRPPLIPAIN